MNDYPDFSGHGYQVIQELGHNRAGGRVTYLAASTKTQLPVVIKQFQFAQLGVNWSDYDAYEQEIAVLRRLNHPSIPRHLGSFETPSGFCLVQEYKQAPSLADSRYFTLEEVKQIAVAVLKVLVYLQQQVPLVVHRDIKPENILVDCQERLKVYLVDFGFARMGGGEVAVSSVIKGTLGFMPPEQLFNRQLTEASDLYSLGATLICLLTKTKSMEIGNLIDETYRINFKQLVPQLDPQFVDWLEKMVAPGLKNRFDNAATALQALQPIDVVDKTMTSRMQACVIGLRVGLAILGGFAWVGTAFIYFARTDSPRKTESFREIESSRDPVRRLLITKQCPKCDLRGANLGGFVLRNANLAGANLAGADLLGADLLGANLMDANLRSAELSYANLRMSNLVNVNLAGAELVSTDLEFANLLDANLSDARLIGAKLGSAKLTDANLKGANLLGADLRDTNINLDGANLQGGTMPNGTRHK